MTKTRHELIRTVLDRHAEGKLTDLEMVSELASIVARTECDCVECIR